MDLGAAVQSALKAMRTDRPPSGPQWTYGEKPTKGTAPQVASLIVNKGIPLCTMPGNRTVSAMIRKKPDTSQS
jgi:hypothetical protein